MKLLVPTVRHSGSRTLLSVIGLPRAKLRQDGALHSNGFTDEVIHSHFDRRMPIIMEMSKIMKTVISLRHPAMIAVSWKKRNTSKYSDANFLQQWLRMPEMTDPFFFKMEEMPFDDLEKFLGLGVNRKRLCIGSIGNYPEKHNIASAKRFLGKDWNFVEQALDTTAGKLYQ